MPLLKRTISGETGVTPENPAELAAEARRRAEAARSQAQQVRVDAEAQAAAILAQADQQAVQLLGDAQRADTEATGLDAQHRRQIEIERLVVEIAGGEQRRQQLVDEADDLEVRLAELNQRRADLDTQRRQNETALAEAIDTTDVGSATTTQAAVATIGTMLAATASKVEQATTRRAAILGDAGELAQLDKQLARLRIKLDAVDREQRGLVPRRELAQLVESLLPMVAAAEMTALADSGSIGFMLDGLPPEALRTLAAGPGGWTGTMLGAATGRDQAARLVAELDRMTIEDPEGFRRLRSSVLHPTRPLPPLPKPIEPAEGVVVMPGGALRYVPPPRQIR